VAKRLNRKYLQT